MTGSNDTCADADMFAMAGVAGIRAAGGPSIPFRPGRGDDTADNVRTQDTTGRYCGMKEREE